MTVGGIASERAVNVFLFMSSTCFVRLTWNGSETKPFHCKWQIMQLSLPCTVQRVTPYRCGNTVLLQPLVLHLLTPMTPTLASLI